jgi:hypothetical protein
MPIKEKKKPDAEGETVKMPEAKVEAETQTDPSPPLAPPPSPPSSPPSDIGSSSNSDCDHDRDEDSDDPDYDPLAPEEESDEDESEDSDSEEDAEDTDDSEDSDDSNDSDSSDSESDERDTKPKTRSNAALKNTGTAQMSLPQLIIMLTGGKGGFRMPGCDGEDDDGDDDDDGDTEDGDDGDDGDDDEKTDVGRKGKKGSVAAAPRAGKRSRTPDPTAGYTKAEQLYFAKQPREAQDSIIRAEKRVRLESGNGAGGANAPMRFKILESNMDNTTKMVILAKLDQFQRMHEGSGEYFKLRNWLNQVCRMPLGKYKMLPVSIADPHEKIATYLQGIRGELDKTVYGHNDAKDQIISVLSRWISNPGSRGQCIGIQGPMGCSKTTLVKDGICRALGLPFGFVALGGASDGSFLEGHGFTYEGSQPGRISEILMKSGFMNTILFFDELDKVSSTRRGDEVIGILTHLTDASQNERFNDRYFSDIDLDLSKSLIVFSYNDESMINPILKDRMVTIRVSGYNKAQKLIIARDYLMPSILAEYNLTDTDIQIANDVIEYIIERVDEEEGVRNLRRGLDAVVGAINMHRYVPPLIALPVIVTDGDVKKYIKLSEDPTKMRAHLRHTMYT